MRWEFTALISACAIGIFNTILEGQGKSLGKDYIAKLSHIMILFVFIGIFALLMCGYLYYTQKKSMNSAVSFILKDPLMCGLHGLLIPLYLFLNIKVLSEGGGVAMAIVNLNIIIPLIGGYVLYNDNIDSTLVIAVILITLLTGFVSYHNAKINT